MARLNWKNLKKTLCPVCDSALVYEENSDGYKCLMSGMKEPYGCEFFITKIRFDEITLEKERGDNQEALNNL